MAAEDRFLIRIAQACSVRDAIYAHGIPGLREIRARNNRANAAVPATPWVPAAKFLAELSQLGTSEQVKCFGIRRGQ
jgi:hypothetical protein